jgi:hypothetical protein
LELASLPAPERRGEISGRRRARIRHVLETHEILSPEALAEVAALPDGAFFTRVRELVRESGVLKERGAGAAGER